MQQGTREMMHAVYDLLSQDQLDDVEAQFENLEVLFSKVAHDSRQAGHVPAIELHAGEITETVADKLWGILNAPLSDEMIISLVKQHIWDYVKGCIMFGLEIGKQGWPIIEKPCISVHSDQRRRIGDDI